MDHEKSSEPASRLSLALAAVGIGAFCAVAVAGILSIATGRSFDLTQLFPNLLFQTAMVSTPFLLLALLNVRTRGPWLLGAVLTLIVWGYFLFVTLRSELGGDVRGINIGTALAMFASPIVITFACLIATLVGRTAKAGGARPPAA
jgi:hypothetical protein